MESLSITTPDDREDPLIDEEQESNDRRRSPPSHRRSRRRKTSSRGRAQPRTRRRPAVGRCIHIFFLGIPIFAASLILNALMTLIFELNINLFYVSISDSLALYTPYYEIMVPIFMGCAFELITAIARGIQVKAYMQRHDQYTCCWAFVNTVASLIQIFAIAALVLLVWYPNDGSEMEQLIHLVGVICYFGLSVLYGILNLILLINQRQYPLFTKLTFIVTTIVMTVPSIVYVAKRDENYEAEWLAFAATALHVGLFAILFSVDPVDEDLLSFFCCRREPPGREATMDSSTAYGEMHHSKV